MEEFVKKDFTKILKHNALSFRREMKNTSTDVFRVYDRNLEEIPVTVEMYGTYCRIVDYSDEGLSEEERSIITDLSRRYLYLESGQIIWRERRKRPEGEQHEKSDESLECIVHENGHEFKVELKKYADTGLFLDHAVTRALVEEGVKGLDVLNLFSYTGSFSVYSAAGGAESVTSVDLSNVYSAWCRDNLRRNGFLDEARYQVVTRDAIKYIIDSAKEGRKWDLIIFDPPAFSNSNKMDRPFDVKKDYWGVLLLLTRLLKTGGKVLFSENISTFQFDKNHLKAYYKINEITDLVHQEGFARKRSALRVWTLEKVKELSEDKMKRIADDDSLESLKLSWEDEKKEERKGVRRERSGGERREGYRRDTEKRAFNDRRENGPARERREDRPFDRRRDEEPRERRFSDRGPSRGERRFDRPYRKDEGRREFSDDRRQSRPYSRDDRSERRPYYEEERRYYTGYSSRRPEERGDRGSFRPYRGEENGRDRGERKSYSSPRKGYSPAPYERREERKRKSPMPYGYDDFRKSVRDDDEE